MRYFIIAGEQSGDLHGSNLVREIKAADINAEIFCWGGDMMEAAGAILLEHYSKTAFMGFLLILKNLRTISNNLERCKNDITYSKPDVVILIDYPGFNMRIARFAKNSGFRVFYYISPKFWAWKEKRVENIRRFVDRMFIIFPFEVDFYKKHKIEVEYRGNPLVDEIERRMSSMPEHQELMRSFNMGNKPVIGILAGSRKQEVEIILPQMLKIVEDFPGYQFVVAGVRNLPDELYYKIIGERPVRLFKEKTYEILRISEAAMVASGTATLEAALSGTPQVVCYKSDFFSMLLGWLLVKVEYISLVNIIMGKEVVKELLGYLVNRKNLVKEVQSLLPGGRRREQILEEYRKLRDKLGPSGASKRIAEAMIRELK